MSYGGDYIYSVLSNDSAVTALIGTALHNARMIPETETGTDTINFYRLGTFDGTLEYFELDWSIDCRSESEYTAESIATAVTEALNRVDTTVGGKIYFGTITVLPIIPPADVADVYNVPVNLTVRRK
ncbi:MAG: hypothetical protein PF693_10990 [Spirochaetia bacterium]|jgi:hypothetical protein|nr:hypothetical protein [Spirochaetia bacterium]